MSDINRVSGAEQAAQDAARAAQKKVKVKNTEKTATQQGAQLQNQGQVKTMKSAFDNVLDTIAEQNAPVLPSAENKFDSRLKEIQSEEDRGGGQEEKHEDDKKTQSKGEKSESSREMRGGVKGRVSGKESMKDQGQGGSGDKQGGQMGKGSQEKNQAADLLKSQQLELKQGPAPTPIFGSPVGSVSTSAEVAPSPRELPKAVLDQIVQSVTISRDKELNQEIQIDFHDNFFNGLRLKVKAKAGEVSIEFITPNRDVEATFRNEREKIAAALGEKGIDVRSIQVSRR